MKTNKRLFKDILYTCIPVFLFLANLYYINPGYPLSNLYFIFSLNLAKNPLLELLIAAFITTLFFASVLGYVKYKTEKEIIEKKYNKYTPFTIGLKGSLIAFLVMLLYSIGKVIFYGGDTKNGGGFFDIVFVIPALIYSVLIIITGVLIVYYFYKTIDKPKFRKVSFYSLNFILIISFPSLYILENQYCITFGEKSVMDCISKKAIQQDDANVCLKFKYKGYGDVIGCVIKYSLSKKSPEYCKKMFNNTIFEIRCYEGYIYEVGAKNFDESLCDRTIDSKYCYQMYNYFKEKII